MLLAAAIVNILLYILFQSHYEANFTKLTSEIIFDTLKCIGKKQLTMSLDCNESENQWFPQLMWAIAGFLETAHEITITTAFALGISVICWTLLSATYTLEGTDITNGNDEFANITRNDLTIIRNLAEQMSKFIGEALLGYLIFHAINAPSDLLYIFSQSLFALLSNLLNHGIIYAGLFIGSIASLRVSNRNNIKRLKYFCLYTYMVQALQYETMSTISD